MSAIAESREALTRLAPPSYFCTCWKVRPSALASVSWFIPNSRRRILMRPPTCTSIGFGTPVPRPYLGAEVGSSSSFADLFNARSPLRRSTEGCNATARSRSEEHTSELQSLRHLVCRLLLEKKKQIIGG